MNRQKMLAYRKKLGNKGEKAAEDIYRAQGYMILERNWRCKAGELDIVATDGKTLIFVEVKTLRYREGARPELNLSNHQRRRNFRAARVYQKICSGRGIPGRFDLVTVIFKGAFIYSLRKYTDYLPMLPPLDEPCGNNSEDLSVREEKSRLGYLKEFFCDLLTSLREMSMRKFLELSFSGCPICGSEDYGIKDGRFCPECLAQLNFFPDKSRCPVCGGLNDTLLAVCPQCAGAPAPPWENAVSIFEYAGLGRKILIRYKFHKASEFALSLGIYGAKALADSGIDCDLIVPVPMHIIRKMIRGYNQAEFFAEIVSQKSGIPVMNLLKSRFSLTTQHSRTRAERYKKVKKHFLLRRPVPAGSRILLVDDVFTTGSTLRAAAEVLLANGAASVSVLTIARRNLISSVKVDVSDVLRLKARGK